MKPNSLSAFKLFYFSASYGNTLLEVLISITVFSLFAVTLVASLLSIGTVQIKADQRLTASQLARSDLEIAYNLSVTAWDEFSQLNGTYHPELIDGRYQLIPDLQTVDDLYTHSLTIGPAPRDGSGNVSEFGQTDPATIKVTSTVTWQTADQPEEITLTTYLIEQSPSPTQSNQTNENQP